LRQRAKRRVHRIELCGLPWRIGGEHVELDPDACWNGCGRNLQAAYAPNGEWKNPRVLWVQYQGVKGNGLEQFKNPARR
jgi:hypothetical protein